MGGGGGEAVDIHVLVSSQTFNTINIISKSINRAEQEYSPCRHHRPSHAPENIS